MTETSNNKEYKDVLKATSMLGGLQVFTILIQVIRGKFVAVLLGTEGVGIAGMFASTIGLLSSFTSFELSSSAVKNIAEAKATNDEQRLMSVIGVFRYLVRITGLLGMIICIVLSPLLSQWAFGNKDFTIAFLILSITLLLSQLTSGQTAVMQGLHKYKFMAKSNLYGQTIGLLFTVPLYYIWGVNAIVPVLVMTSVTSLVLSFVFFRRLNLKNVNVRKEQIKTDGKNIVKMGFSISMTSIVATLVMYLFRLIISNIGGLSEVGLYTAGFTIVNTYVGLVVKAMGTDYYPRLSAVNGDTDKFNYTINNQMEIAFLLLGPIIALFLVFSHLGIIVLYSSKFLPAEGMIYWAVYAVFFKMFSWCISFSYLAKGAAKMFIINEMISVTYTFGSQVAGYYYFGLEGIGIAYVFTYIIYSVQVYLICSRKFGVRIRKDALKIFFKQLPLITFCLILAIIGNPVLKYCLGGAIIFYSGWCSYVELNKRLDFRTIINKRFHKR